MLPPAKKVPNSRFTDYNVLPTLVGSSEITPSISEPTAPRFATATDAQTAGHLLIQHEEHKASRKPRHLSPSTSTDYFRLRRTLRTLVKGNNSYGRTGKRRCIQCRKWKHKVYICPKLFLKSVPVQRGGFAVFTL